jgi:uncharacterized protein YjbJ (UPF0337 family)
MKAASSMPRKWCTVSGQSDQVKGRAKEIAGTVLGDKNLESEGKADRRVGEGKEKLDHAKGKVKALIDQAGDKGKEAIDKVKGR